MLHIAQLDSSVDADELDEDGWALRYHLEDQIIQLDVLEEVYWRQRSKVQWTLKGMRARPSSMLLLMVVEGSA
jgi:hypothetical protein